MFNTLRIVLLVRGGVGNRWRRSKTKWVTAESSGLRNDPTYLALNHFDKHYQAQFGKDWPSIRLGLLSLQKYGALINNNCHKDQATERLGELGANDFVQQAASDLKKSCNDKATESGHHHFEDCNKGGCVDDREKPSQGISPGIYDQKSQGNSWKDNYVVAAGHESKLEYMIGLNYYQDDVSLLDEVDVPIEMVDQPINIGLALKCFIFPAGNFQRFPSSGIDPTSGLLHYYLMDASSLLPVIALNIQSHDTVLDMCAAPGGKALAMFGSLEKGGIVLNDPSTARIKRLSSVIESYLPQEVLNSGRVQVTSVEGQEWGLAAQDTFNKILVDVPCTTDRLSLKEKENNIFKPRRSKERWELPSLQENLLCSALRSVKPGGDVVYSTCSLSSLQNDAVIQGAILKCKEEYDITVQVVDLSPLALCTKSVFTYSSTTKYGQLIVPDLTKNFGPMFYAKLHRT